MKKQNWLQRLGSNPEKSWSRFKLGLVIFSAGAALILLGARYWVWLQVIGLLFLIAGTIPAAVGYAGILAYRLTAGFKPPPASFDKDK